MSMVLLREPVRLSEQSVAAVLDGMLSEDDWKITAVKGNGALCELNLHERSYAVIAPPIPIPADTLSAQLSQPQLAPLRTSVEAHRGHLAVTSKDSVSDMAQAVNDAAVIQMLSWKLGGDAAPLATFWAGSEGLWDWQQFASDAEALWGSLANDETSIPARFWVSIRMRQDGERFGGHTRGLRSFTGYELDVAPLAWPMEEVAERLTQVVDYLFRQGPVLHDGQSLGVTADEKFRISLEDDGDTLRLTLEGGKS